MCNNNMDQPLNNLSKDTFSKTTTPDLLRNLNPEGEEKNEKNYNKQRIGDKNQKPINTDYPLEPVGKLVEVQDSLQEPYTTKRKLKRALCCFAWIFCCPVMALGLSRRESPDPNDPDDLRDDPCLPCYYDVYYNPRDPYAPTPTNHK